MKDNGGPAYPTKQLAHGRVACIKEGMTLRDRFVIAAMESGQCPYAGYEHEAAARWAGNRADAMIAER